MATINLRLPAAARTVSRLQTHFGRCTPGTPNPRSRRESLDRSV